MRRTPKVIFGFIIMIVILTITCMYLRIVAPSYELYRQLNQIVSTQDKTKIKSIALDDSTEQFLLNTPNKAKITTTDFQGGEKVKDKFEIGYFGAKINNERIGCYMVLDTSSFSVIPHWKLIKASLKPVFIDPSWINN